ncbi:hypothetical protein [Nostoc sp.]|uniref:hypothetical protein n=1 Tax=Nostoc sp. TaxID=1180 RepID=UPI002FF4B110
MLPAPFPSASSVIRTEQYQGALLPVSESDFSENYAPIAIAVVAQAIAHPLLSCACT